MAGMMSGQQTKNQKEIEMKKTLLAVVLMAASSVVNASWVSWADHNDNEKASVVIKSIDPLTLIDDIGRFIDVPTGRNQITFRNGLLEYRGEPAGPKTKIPFNAERFQILFGEVSVPYTYLGGGKRRPVYDIGPRTVSGINVLPDTPAVPVPAAAWLFGSALIGLAVVARRKRS